MVGQMSTFVYMGWMGGQPNVYVDIFPSLLEDDMQIRQHEPKNHNNLANDNSDNYLFG